MSQIKFLLLEDKKEAYLYIREAVTDLVNSDRIKPHVSCGSATNCSFCCHDKIIMGEVEAEYVKSVIIEKKIVPNIHRIQAQNSFAPIKWIDKACPMLQDENEKGQRLCSIYEDRPLICRTHNSTIDPLRCNKDLYPDQTIREAKFAPLDAFSYTSFSLGQGLNNPTDSLVTMHEMLYKM
jgi:Fe-S-cluster containining protein